MGKQADVCFLHVLLRFVTKPRILAVINAGNNIILFHFKQLLLCILQTHVQFISTVYHYLHHFPFQAASAGSIGLPKSFKL